MTVEMLGAYGWEQVATAFLQNGRYLSGQVANHYSIGSYQEKGKTFDAKVRITQHG